MKIKVNSYSSSLYWYSKHPNEVFDVIRREILEITWGALEPAYWVRTPEGTTNFILEKDCEVL